MARILIADDHAIIREGLKQILARTPDIVVGAEASNGAEVLARVRESEFHAVLMDLSMPGRNGLDILRELKSEPHAPPVLILSVHPESHYGIRALRAGAAGYLTKEAAPDLLVDAIRKVSRGGRYISPSLGERLASEIENDSAKPLHDTLSDREHQVLCLIGSGKTVKEISDALSLSVPSISTYRARILEKMKMNNNAELIHYAVTCGLVE